MLQNISIKKLCPHPDNPRKDLGDLTELVDSIKAQGILQNLTVVPRKDSRCLTCNLYLSGVGKCSEGYDKELTALIHAPENKDREHIPCPKWEWREAYTVVIGHRRLAAAKLAGLEEVPCAITEMTPQEQIATMLLENMQRSDLTVYEQAYGIQMMLDLGETVSNISEKTGFSETTVRRRVKLLELDQDKFKASVGRGATLMDYAELEKIEDITLRNKVLDSLGTPNFRYELQRAIDKEKQDKNMAVLLAELEKFATRTDNSSGLQYVSSYYLSQSPKVTIPEDAETVKYFFVVNYGYITLYKESSNPVNSTPAISEKEQARREKRAALAEISKRAYQLRSDFVREISNTRAKKSMGVIIEYALRVMLGDYSYLGYEDFTEFLGIKVSDEVEEWGFDVIAEHVTAQPERHMLIATYLMHDSENEHYYNWNNQHNDNENLNVVYDFLEKLGYEMSDEEKSMRDGTNELFEDSED